MANGLIFPSLGRSCVGGGWAWAGECGRVGDCGLEQNIKELEQIQSENSVDENIFIHLPHFTSQLTWTSPSLPHFLPLFLSSSTPTAQPTPFSGGRKDNKINGFQNDKSTAFWVTQWSIVLSLICDLQAIKGTLAQP